MKLISEGPPSYRGSASLCCTAPSSACHDAPTPTDYPALPVVTRNSSLILAEALSRRIGRVVTLEGIGLGGTAPASLNVVDWHAATLTALTDFARVAVDAERIGDL